MVFARGLFFKRKTSKRARQKNARAFSAACGSQRILIMGKIKSGFEGILEGKKETRGVLGFRDSKQKKKEDDDDEEEDFEREQRQHQRGVLSSSCRSSRGPKTTTTTTTTPSGGGV